MKKIYLSLLALIMLLLSACLKDKPAVDFSTVGTIIEILPVNGGGLENFGGAELNFDPTETIDSAAIVLNIASPKPLNKALTISMEVNDNIRSAYNSANPVQYDAFPDSLLFFPGYFSNHSCRQALRYPAGVFLSIKDRYDKKLYVTC